jgi:hypothetical protein
LKKTENQNRGIVIAIMEKITQPKMPVAYFFTNLFGTYFAMPG